MKNYLGVILCLGLLVPCTTIKAQTESTLFEKVTNMEKKVDKLNLYLNVQGSGDANYMDEFSSRFMLRQLRIEAKGNINDRFSYRYRQRLNRGNNGGGNIDNLPTSIDIAGIGINVTKKFSIFAGKQCAAYGGIEFDLNPIEIYEYSDMIEYMSNFLTGVNFAYQIAPSHQVQFQILDSRNNSLEDTYGAGFTKSKIPMLFTLNWNGNFNNTFKTRWSASLMNETKDNQMYYVALGNQLTVNKFDAFFDFMYSTEDIDRKGIMTNLVGNMSGHNALDACYTSLVLKLNYHITPQWNIFAKGMYETAGLSEDVNGLEKGTYRTSYGYFAGAEYYPNVEGNLHFFLTYVGRHYAYDDRAKAVGLENLSNSTRVSLGFIYQLPLF